MDENIHIAGNKLVVNVIIENKMIQFRVDTGAYVSLCRGLDFRVKGTVVL